MGAGFQCSFLKCLFKDSCLAMDPSLMSSRSMWSTCHVPLVVLVGVSECFMHRIYRKGPAHAFMVLHS